MSAVRAVSAADVPVPSTPHSLEGAPGFGESLEALLKPAAPAGSVTSRDVQFSRHAQARMDALGVRLDPQEQSELGEAIDGLARRGARESLVLLGDHAVVVDVADRKVVSFMRRSEAAGTIFTQIDSTAVVR
ncbi:MAG: hypothetical protein RLZZ299_113 [Pseudomonadota bacterium]